MKQAGSFSILMACGGGSAGGVRDSFCASRCRQGSSPDRQRLR